MFNMIKGIKWGFKNTSKEKEIVKKKKKIMHILKRIKQEHRNKKI